ncbi:MAG: hypothetical protein J5492_02010, partial [Oxalobacter sp.]|nr:hypothetical protein [Oxalobacter sp.]
PKGSPSLLATFDARAGFALPAKIISLLSDMAVSFHYRFELENIILCYSITFVSILFQQEFMQYFAKQLENHRG